MVFNLQQDFEIGLDFHKKGNIVEAEQATWDDLSDEDKAASNGRPATITLP